jgi:hypothetical protein
VVKEKLDKVSWDFVLILEQVWTTSTMKTRTILDSFDFDGERPDLHHVTTEDEGQCRG